MKYPVSEIFYSIQGEGRLAGTPSVFVRLAGCYLRCPWCDTQYAWERDEATELSADEIAERVEAYAAAEHLVVTGGEPLIHAELPELLKRLRATKAGGHITVETSGVQYRPLDCELVSISPKLVQVEQTGYCVAEAAEDVALDEDEDTRPMDHRQLYVTALRRYLKQHEVQLKFVVAGPGDLPEVKRSLAELAPLGRATVFLMPKAEDYAALTRVGPVVAKMCLESGLRYGPRLHVRMWGAQRGR